MKEGVERAGEVALRVDQRGTLGGARARGDGIVKLLLFRREPRGVDIGQTRHE